MKRIREAAIIAAGLITIVALGGALAAVYTWIILTVARWMGPFA